MITIDDLNGVTFGPVGPSGSTQSLFQVTDNVTKVWGKHTLKFGGSFIDMIATNYFIQRVTGNYEYVDSSICTCSTTRRTCWESVAREPPAIQLDSCKAPHMSTTISAFCPNLTINLGLRYEYVTVPVASRYQDASAPASVPGGSRSRGRLRSRPILPRDRVCLLAGQ